MSTGRPSISAISKPDSGFELPGNEPKTASTCRVVGYQPAVSPKETVNRFARELQPLLNALPLGEGETGWALSQVVGWHYPFPVWAAFLALLPLVDPLSEARDHLEGRTAEPAAHARTDEGGRFVVSGHSVRRGRIAVGLAHLSPQIARA